MAELWCGSHHFLASILTTISQIQVLDYFIIVCHSHIMVELCTISSHNQGCHIIECHNSEVRFSMGMAHKVPQQRVTKSYPLWANTTELEDIWYCKFDKPCAPTIIKIRKCDLLFSTTLLN